jgi:oxygen-dependent protoporphyrinogen oxidase
MTSARVIGAGLSGLATAWCLADRGVHVEIVEAAAAPGGLLRSRRTPHGLVESAANAFTWNDDVEAWFKRLDIAPQFPEVTSRRRFIFRDGHPRRWPLSVSETGALGASIAWSALQRRMRPVGDESVADWGERVLGRAATAWLLEPALQGIYGATSDRLAARAVFGSRRRGRSLAAPADGMGAFVDRLAERLDRRGVVFSFNARTTSLDPSIRTVVCTDARTSGDLVAPYAPALSAAIRAIPMNALVSATAFFPPHPADTHGFGVLFPRQGGIVALGVLLNADIFSGRSTMRSETWIYGWAAGRPLPSERDLAAMLVQDRSVLTGRREPAVALFIGGRDAMSPGDDPVHASWLPVYDASVLLVNERLADLPPWLGLAGNYTGRLGVAKLLDVASEAAERLAATSSRPARE